MYSSILICCTRVRPDEAYGSGTQQSIIAVMKPVAKRKTLTQYILYETGMGIFFSCTDLVLQQ